MLGRLCEQSLDASALRSVAMNDTFLVATLTLPSESGVPRHSNVSFNSSSRRRSRLRGFRTVEMSA